jgi:hypothetical protein
MRVENALRWQRLWWFLSLDLPRVFYQHLWLHERVDALHEYSQNIIDPETDLPTFGSDPREKAYRTLTSFDDVFGAEASQSIIAWQRSVFVQGGDDRIEEFVWRMLARELLERASEFSLGEDLRSSLQRFRSLSERRYLELDKHLAESATLPLSIWDHRVILAEGESQQTVLNLIKNICSSNIFSITWHEVCTSRGPSFLGELFESALKVTMEDTAGRLIFSVDTLPFPSSWELPLRKTLDGIAATSAVP